MACEDKLARVDELVDGLNVYNILEPCYHAPEKIKTKNIELPSSFRLLGQTARPLAVRKRMFGRAWPLRAPVRAGIVPSWSQLLGDTEVPCTNDEVATAWLNNEAVRKAIHTDKSLAGNWELCTDKLNFDHDAGSMIPFHKNLTLKGYRALIFSGDHDMCLPFTGSEAWVRSLGYKVIDEWRPWTSNKQVVGYLRS
ncbi:serine carboxypeptidase-like 20 [Cucurbita pepo subsp. pepo]|uniref:serine carboxypeptidase-like 20 n=1 Tax=Cucurbita pepo subsp. pepo TaxID=3664 RepID=UPI000C9D7035|nr:serine carboxypeptidase-like 20 [Cucurbita pepo subsp. pepo]